MPMAPYVLVLARNAQEGAKYAKRVPLTRGRYRIVASAGSIGGIRRAHVHRLPGFDQRPDKHAILAVLRHARCEWFDVVMPSRAERAAVDQGDGMGEQLTIEDAIESANLIEQHSDALEGLARVANSESVDTVVAAAIEHNVNMTEALEAHAERDQSEDINVERTAILQPVEPPDFENLPPLTESEAHTVAEVEHKRETREEALERFRRSELVGLPADESEHDEIEVAPKRRRTRCEKCGELHFKDQDCAEKPPMPQFDPGMFD